MDFTSPTKEEINPTPTNAFRKYSPALILVLDTSQEMVTMLISGKIDGQKQG